MIGSMNGNDALKERSKVQLWAFSGASHAITVDLFRTIDRAAVYLFISLSLSLLIFNFSEIHKIRSGLWARLVLSLARVSVHNRDEQTPSAMLAQR